MSNIKVDVTDFSMVGPQYPIVRARGIVYSAAPAFNAKWSVQKSAGKMEFNVADAKLFTNLPPFERAELAKAMKRQIGAALQEFVSQFGTDLGRVFKVDEQPAEPVLTKAKLREAAETLKAQLGQSLADCPASDKWNCKYCEQAKTCILANP